MLTEIVELSHEFGKTDYVRGGGGNTSFKNDQKLWVKPSGTTLATIKADQFVVLDRAKVRVLFDTPTPEDSAAREELVKNVMAASVLPDVAGRPSVEAPLHESFTATYVVHTHPALVNGMTCAQQGVDACKRLFPDALWVNYIDPGYTLCMQVRKAMLEYENTNGKQPQILFLKNHGVFIAADTPDEIHSLYDRIMTALRAEYTKAGIAMSLTIPTAETTATQKVTEAITDAFNKEMSIATSGPFRVAEGPISPDHIVYSKSFAFTEELTNANLKQFEHNHGYLPRVIASNNCIAGVGDSKNVAELALELAQDGALVTRLATAFGGIEYMTDQARLFIENWEVEAYRQKVSSGK